MPSSILVSGMKSNWVLILVISAAVAITSPG